MLSEELVNLQKSICHDCKKKFVPSYTQVASSWSEHRPSVSYSIVSGPKVQSPVSTTKPRGSPNTSITIHPITARQNQPKTAISAPPQVPSAPSPRQPETIPVDEIQSKQPGWSIFHNPEIKQALHIDLVKTFNFIAKVYCVKFSPDGKYLAVGLDKTGKTYIYDVEKGSKLWLAPLLTVKANALC